MGFPLYSLKTGIVACLSLLIVSAMLLINIVMIRFAERDMIDAKIEMGHLLIHSIGQIAGYEMMTREDSQGPPAPDQRLREEIAQVLKKGEFSSVLMVSAEGMRIPRIAMWENNGEDAFIHCIETLRTEQASIEFFGKIWGVTWFAPERIRICAPMVFKGRTLGAAAIGADLFPLYQTLRSSESVVLGYICLNTMILVLFGIYLLSRTVLKPIRRLLTITEKFDEWPALVPAGETSRNEFGQLFRSLKMMLTRLEENKEELKAHIASLETANREIKKAQNDMIRSEKMATAGRLATGVAHEIGNPLGIILGYLELLKRGDLSREERDDFLGRTEAEVNRIHLIIRELLDFSRTSGPHSEETAVHELITETVHMLKSQPMMEQIDIQQALKAENDLVRANASQLKQVFLNIILNAADAMSDAGMSDQSDSRKMLEIETDNNDGFIRVTVTDTGTGIPLEAQGRIFDPFFTTKAPGKGTGLGLSVCYTIMKGLGGAIRVESPAGRGTCVIVDIPLAVNPKPRD
ncbi:MAG: HAMP domain-containing protein [Deltaproteobacteria bacterium]|nr:HAMP domain-containing protein [Deltaproteobacteria bacterium]